MKQIRILVADIPKMLVDIIADIVASAPDLKIVGAIDQNIGLASAAQEAEADVVITRQVSRELDAEEMTMLIGSHPRVLAITDDGRQGFIYDFRPHRSSFGEMSAEGLLSAIRAAAQDKV